MSEQEIEFSLREKKYAKTKLALLNEFIARSRVMKFADISIKEICEAVEVSEATFYNYFPQKKDVVFYHKALLGLRLGWIISNELKGQTPIQIIHEIFNIMSHSVEDRNLFYEFVMIMIAEENRRNALDFPLTAAEKYYAYPELKGIELIDYKNIEDLLRDQLENAKGQGLILPEVNIEEALISLFSIMIGAPLCMEKDAYPQFRAHYQTQLRWFWKAIGTEEIKS